MHAISTFELEKGHEFVAGLFWLPLTKATKSLQKAEIGRLAKEQHCDVMVTRLDPPQLGLGDSELGVSVGMLSAAAVISKGLEIEGLSRNAIGGLPIGDGRFLYFAQRDGVTLPDGDYLGSEEEVHAKIDEMLSINDWGTVIAPDSWGIPNSVDRSFDAFLPRKKNGTKIDYKKWWAVQLVNKKLINPKAVMPVLGVACLVLVSAYGYTKYKQHVAEVAKAAFDAAQLSSEMLRNNHPAAKPVHPWIAQPTPSAFAEACDGAMRQVGDLFPIGWTFTGSKCTLAGLTVEWSRQDYGRIDHIKSAQPNAQISRDGKTAGRTIPLTLIAGGDDPLDGEVDRINAFNNVAQSLDFELTVAAPAAPKLLPGQGPGAPDPNAPAPDWKELSFTMSGLKLQPTSLAGAIEAHGLRITSITTAYADGIMNWTMEGTQYVSP